MIWLYRLFFPFFLLGSSPRYLARMRRRGGYREGFEQRFGRLRGLPERRPGVPRVWIQAVSVGEILATEPVIRGLRGLGAEIVLTTTTSTGFRLAAERLGNAVTLRYFPIDWAPFSAAAWKAIDPDLAIVAEGERWPEHLNQAAGRSVPVICINARVSDRSYRRLRRLPSPLRGLILGGMSRILAASEEDATRFRTLGIEPSRIQVTGNVKLDVSIPPLSADDRARLLGELGLEQAGLILLGSSTWQGEEAALAAALAASRAAGVRCSLLVVPRHAERRAEIEAALRPSGFSYHLRSKGAAPGPVDIAVGDTTGELRSLTQLADLVFVGKSLSPHTDGQTPVEAASLGKPLILGPGMANFRSIARELVRLGAAVQVDGPEGLARIAAELLGEAGRREAMAQASLQWRRANGGAVAKTLVVLSQELREAMTDNTLAFAGRVR